MPNHIVHDRSTILAAAAAAGVAVVLTRSLLDASVLSGSVLLSGTMLSPDLDIFVSPSWKYVLAPRGGIVERLRKQATGLRQVGRFGAVTSSRPLRRWGPFGVLWLPYRMGLFAWWILAARKRGPGADTNYGHRSILSHTPLLADALRLGYLLCLGTVAYGCMLSVLHRGSWTLARASVASLVQAHQHTALLVLAGCTIATGIHSLLDHFIPD